MGQAFEELEKLLAKNNICIAVRERLVKDSGVAGDAAYNGIVLKVNSKPKAKGVIIFGSDQEVSGVMRAVRRNNLTGNFNFIGSDGWAGRLLVSEGNEPEVEGTLAFLPQAHPVKGFDNYFLGLTPINNRRNPWFVGEFSFRPSLSVSVLFFTSVFDCLQNFGNTISSVATHPALRLRIIWCVALQSNFFKNISFILKFCFLPPFVRIRSGRRRARGERN